MRSRTFSKARSLSLARYYKKDDSRRPLDFQLKGFGCGMFVSSLQECCLALRNISGCDRLFFIAICLVVSGRLRLDFAFTNEKNDENHKTSGPGSMRQFFKSKCPKRDRRMIFKFYRHPKSSFKLIRTLSTIIKSLA